jgi:hypothetical protein
VWFVERLRFRASNKMIGDCPDFPVPWEEGTDRRLVGTVPLSEIILLDALALQSAVIFVEIFVEFVVPSPEGQSLQRVALKRWAHEGRDLRGPIPLAPLRETVPASLHK